MSEPQVIDALHGFNEAAAASFVEALAGVEPALSAVPGIGVASAVGCRSPFPGLRPLSS
ncbi:MAG: hypothetical protein MZW92_60865 [Comamonadaceae bacterium]|nr:hypothetical protein [Comamonadaceae bacterium]